MKQAIIQALHFAFSLLNWIWLEEDNFFDNKNWGYSIILKQIVLKNIPQACRAWFSRFAGDRQAEGKEIFAAGAKIFWF